MTTPNTLAELKNARQAAGERYAAAVVEIEAAFIELSAYDRVLQNGNVNRLSGAPYEHRSFRGGLDLLPADMRHPDFGSYTTEFNRRINSMAIPIIDALS
ncbi:hypothetical protein [Rhizobium sp. TRM95796]|uniref:hypothetical protein n=1 Tax=Rhizobium sp. TRM95796 TaxID=2979862 RepID=UPI0021E859AE|nr:hypothetical protein [Rhizobium sp. TRM95796]MCV3764040.1 hypothetical protein [Rhizobium sp. TRM95796]